jgi:hypothetical protein
MAVKEKLIPSSYNPILPTEQELEARLRRAFERVAATRICENESTDDKTEISLHQAG